MHDVQDGHASRPFPCRLRHKAATLEVNVNILFRCAAVAALLLLAAPAAHAKDKGGSTSAKYDKSNIEIPSAQELFDSIERAGGKQWNAAFPKIDADRYKSTEARALNLGRTAAWAAVAVKARNTEALKEYIVAIKKFAQTMGIRKEIIADLATFDQLIKNEDWEALEAEVTREDQKIRDNLRRQLRAEDEVNLSVIGGWIAAEEIATGQLAAAYDEQQSAVIRTPDLVEQIAVIVYDLTPNYKNAALSGLSDNLAAIHRLMKVRGTATLPLENVKKLNKIFSRLSAQVAQSR